MPKQPPTDPKLEILRQQGTLNLRPEDVTDELFKTGEFFDARGMQIGSNESLNLFLFPQYDAKGRADIAFVAAELDRAEQVFRAVDLLAGE